MPLLKQLLVVAILSLSITISAQSECEVQVDFVEIPESFRDTYTDFENMWVSYNPVMFGRVAGTGNYWLVVRELLEDLSLLENDQKDLVIYEYAQVPKKCMVPFSFVFIRTPECIRNVIKDLNGISECSFSVEDRMVDAIILGKKKTAVDENYILRSFTGNICYLMNKDETGKYSIEEHRKMYDFTRAYSGAKEDFYDAFYGEFKLESSIEYIPVVVMTFSDENEH